MSIETMSFLSLQNTMSARATCMAVLFLKSLWKQQYAISTKAQLQSVKLITRSALRAPDVRVPDLLLEMLTNALEAVSLTGLVHKSSNCRL